MPNPSRRHRSRSMTIAAVVAIASIAMASCSSSGGGGPNANGKVSEAPIPSFTISLRKAPASLDIAKDYNTTSMQVSSLITEPIEHISESGKTTPNIAEKVTQPDDKTIVYTLRSGVKFTDGKALTPDDVVWSLKHVADAAGGAQTAGELASIASINATGTNEVTVKLSQPDPAARSTLAVVGFVQEKAFGEAHTKDLGTAAAPPVGTGPYVVKSFTAQNVELTRNPLYWGTKPTAESLTVTFIAQDTAAQLAMRSGEIQGAQLISPDSASGWQRVNGAKLVRAPGLQSEYLSLDTSKPPLNDIHVRKAIAYSIDRPGVLKAAYGDSAKLLTTVAPAEELSGVAGSLADVEKFFAGLPQYAYDMDKAKAELKQSAYANGFTITATYLTEYPWSKLAVLNLQQSMMPLGVSVVPKALSAAQWLSAVYDHTATEIQPYIITANSPDPNGMLATIIGKQNIAPQRFNIANWTTAKVEEAYPKMTSSTDDQTRWQATQTILTEMANEVPYIPLFAPENLYVLAGGFAFDKTMSTFDFTNGQWMAHLRATK